MMKHIPGLLLRERIFAAGLCLLFLSYLVLIGFAAFALWTPLISLFVGMAYLFGLILAFAGFSEVIRSEPYSLSHRLLSYGMFIVALLILHGMYLAISALFT